MLNLVSLLQIDEDQMNSEWCTIEKSRLTKRSSRAIIIRIRIQFHFVYERQKKTHGQQNRQQQR